MKKYIFYILLSLFFFQCQLPQNESGSEAEKGAVTSSQTPTVEVVHPQKRIFEATIEITGNLEANQMVTLYAMEGGFVKTIGKDIGDYVKKDQTVAVLENPALIQQLNQVGAEHEKAKSGSEKAQAGISQAEAVLNFKQKNYERLKGAYDKAPDLIRVDELEKAEAELQVARANLEAARVDLRTAQSAVKSAEALKNAFQTRVSMLTVRAPFSGYISKRHVDKGALIPNSLNNSNAQPIVDLVDLNKLRLVVEYPESDLAFIRQGTSVKIHFPALPGKTYEAKIDRMAAVLNPMSKTVRAEIDLVDKGGKLKPGMYAKVSTLQKSIQESIAVPIQAITSVKNQSFVFKVDNKIAKKVPVSLGLEDKYYIELLNTDITPEDLVVIQGKGLISEGTEVIAKEKE